MNKRAQKFGVIENKSCCTANFTDPPVTTENGDGLQKEG